MGLQPISIPISSVGLKRSLMSQWLLTQRKINTKNSQSTPCLPNYYFPCDVFKNFFLSGSKQEMHNVYLLTDSMFNDNCIIRILGPGGRFFFEGVIFLLFFREKIESVEPLGRHKEWVGFWAWVICAVASPLCTSVKSEWQKTILI